MSDFTDPAPLNLRAQLVRIDHLLADTQRKQRDYHLAPWQIAITLPGGAAAFFAAGAAFIKLIGQ